jgi:phosphatidylserine decarboxylase
VYLFYILLIVCYFFRDPIRDIIYNNENFLSPADGKIVSIKPFEDEDLGKSIKIAIFLSFFNVHRQWIPLNAKVIDSNYNPGKFFGAFKDKSSEKNEQTSILFSDINKNKFKIKQIAGFVARRIVNHMNPNLDVSQGQKLGFIKFGSRVEIIVPENFEIRVKKGMKVKGCKTVIGKFF